MWNISLWDRRNKFFSHLYTKDKPENVTNNLYIRKGE